MQVQPLDTGAVSGSETVTLSLEAGNGYTVDSDDNAAAVTIYNNDLPTASIAATVSQVNEPGGGSGLFTVTRNGPTGEPLLVNYTIGGSAANGQGYKTIPASVVIPGGQHDGHDCHQPASLGPYRRQPDGRPHAGLGQRLHQQ